MWDRLYPLKIKKVMSVDLWITGGMPLDGVLAANQGQSLCWWRACHRTASSAENNANILFYAQFVDPIR